MKDGEIIKVVRCNYSNFTRAFIITPNYGKFGILKLCGPQFRVLLGPRGIKYGVEFGPRRQDCKSGPNS